MKHTFAELKELYENAVRTLVEEIKSDCDYLKVNAAEEIYLKDLFKAHCQLQVLESIDFLFCNTTEDPNVLQASIEGRLKLKSTSTASENSLFGEVCAVERRLYATQLLFSWF